MKNHLLALLLMIICANVQANIEPRQVRHQEVNISDFVKQLDVLRQKANIPGLSVAVLQNQRLVLAAGLGLANLEYSVPATAETLYNIASVSKPLSAVVAMKLVEMGHLDLDQPLSSYSQWADFCAAFSEQPSIFAKDLRCKPTVHSLRNLLSHSATGTPSTSFSYNPVLYSWASRPISATAKMPFSTLVQQYVFNPADMKMSARIHRGLPLREDLSQWLAPPYRLADSGKIVPAPALAAQGDGAAGGVISTVLDLAKFDIALDSGKLVSAQSVNAMMTPTLSTHGKPLPYGIGWYIQEHQGQQLVWHSGWWEQAYSALYLKVPAQNLTLILLANSEGIWWDNPLELAKVENSSFAQLFLETFLETQQ